MAKLAALTSLLLLMAPAAPRFAFQTGAAKKSRAAKSADRRLTLEQIRKLVAIHTPDDVIAQEITSRGIKDDYSRTQISDFQRLGAGRQTITALENSLPVATLVITSQPGATVILDSGTPIEVGPAGNVSISSVAPGQHRLTIDKQYFKSAVRNIAVKGRETITVEAPLDWAVGFLSVSTQPPASQIQIAGKSAMNAPVTHQPVPVGSTPVVASAPLREQVSRTVNIEPGKEVSISLSLPVDEAAVRSAANNIHSSFKSRLYQSVIDEGASYLQSGARDGDVLGEIAVSYLELGQVAQFRDLALQTLNNGGTLRFQVEHHHAGLRNSVHPALLMITRQTLIFEPVGSCNFQRFETPLNTVHIGARNGVFLTSEERIPSISLVLPNPSNPKKQSTINITMPENNGFQLRLFREFLQGIVG
jgi:hypothetical protein